MYKILLFAILPLFFIAIDTNAEIQTLLKTSTSWDGGKFSYPVGQAELTVGKLVLKQGVTAPFHCHPVPTFGYVLKGKVHIETKAGKSTVIHQGQVAVEVMDTAHRGKAVGGDAEILVFLCRSKRRKKYETSRKWRVWGETCRDMSLSRVAK